MKEELIQSWIELTAIIKNNRVTKKVSYNEAIILNYAYHAYLKDEGLYMQEIIKKTKMLKSLCNRTIHLLIEKDFLRRELDGNQVVVYLNPDKVQDYLEIHKETFTYLEPIFEVLDEKDQQDFIRISQKISRRLS
ncbi:MAG: hypothetical protein K2K48_07700 [Anaeroplasmataceae bacterium]|nr:hypothetical protein [Anaeroplasmataceae bacterium]MDE6415286.1 hypothetical protein [Anaeroplasmataceae bacterium]